MERGQNIMFCAFLGQKAFLTGEAKEECGGIETKKNSPWAQSSPRKPIHLLSGSRGTKKWHSKNINWREAGAAKINARQFKTTARIVGWMFFWRQKQHKPTLKIYGWNGQLLGLLLRKDVSISIWPKMNGKGQNRERPIVWQYKEGITKAKAGAKFHVYFA
jgi:hypothetical protein